VCKPGSITPHTKFKAEAYVLTKEEGRAAHAVFLGVPAAVLLPDDGRDGGYEVGGRRGDGDARGQRELRSDMITPVALEKGLRFAIREGGHTVGAGAVTEIIE